MNEVSYGAPRPEAAYNQGATLGAQQAGGLPATDALAQDFLARLQRDIDEQVDLRVQQRLAAPASSQAAGSRPINPATDLPIAICSIVGAIPLTAIAGRVAELQGMAVVWVGLILINLAWSRRR